MIYVNRDEIEGKFSVNIALLTNEDGMPYEEVTGIIETEEDLPRKFLVLAGGMAVLKNITITSISFGSEEETVLYNFTAEEYEIIK